MAIPRSGRGRRSLSFSVWASPAEKEHKIRMDKIKTVLNPKLPRCMFVLLKIYCIFFSGVVSEGLVNYGLLQIARRPKFPLQNQPKNNGKRGICQVDFYASSTNLNFLPFDSYILPKPPLLKGGQGGFF
jgi:hypothetical protein